MIQSTRYSLNIHSFVSHGLHPEVLEVADAKNADMIIALALFD